MKKLFFLSLILAIGCALLFSCGDSDPSQGAGNSTGGSVHYHSFDRTTWVTSAEGHYNPCTCHPDAYVMKEHVDNLDWNGICDVCQYVLRTADKYTLTVVDNEGNPVEGAVFVLRSNNDVTVTTDANGMASVEFTDVSGVNAVLESLPEGYEADKNVFPFKSFELTITVTKK